MTVPRFYRKVLEKTGQASPEAAKVAAGAVLRAPRDRLTPEQALASIREARWVTLAVFAALKEQLSLGEAEDVWEDA